MRIVLDTVGIQIQIAPYSKQINRDALFGDNC